MNQEPTLVETVATGWRYKLGLFFFMLAVISPALSPLVGFTELSTEWKATLVGFLLVGGPEVFTVAAVALLGKSGFNQLKTKLFAFFKRHAPKREVSRTRYYVGLTMLFLPVVLFWLLGYLPPLIPLYLEHRLPVNITADFIFVASFFVLGGDFWDKVRALFVYEANAQTQSVTSGTSDPPA